MNIYNLSLQLELLKGDYFKRSLNITFRLKIYFFMLGL